MEAEDTSEDCGPIVIAIVPQDGGKGSVIVARQRGSEMEMLDLTALAKICRPLGVKEVEGAPVVVVEPLDKQQDPALFDKQVQAAGLKAYLRAPFPGETERPQGAKVI
jgi:hypothetical protein